MKKIKIIFIFTCGFSLIASGQESVVASGGTSTGSGGNASYTLGQVAYTTNAGAAGTVEQGVQQAFEIYTTGVDNYPEITMEFTIYPNPTTGTLLLNVANYDTVNLHYTLWDSLGRFIRFNKISQSETFIELTNLPSALYLVTITDKDTLLKTFKIIKN